MVGFPGRRVKLQGLRRVLREILYPEGALCLNCEKISDGGCLCPACRQEYREGNLLDSWVSRDLRGATAWSVRPHQGAARQLVLRMKHGAEKRAAKELAAVLQNRPEYFPAFPPDTVVTWVPGPRKRIRERCIDHGRVLAEAVAGELGLPCRGLLERRGNDRPQARLDRAGREKNLQRAFEPLEEVKFPVLLVDDVLTTGTTAQRCVDALRAGGAGEITVLTMTHAS